MVNESNCPQSTNPPSIVKDRRRRAMLMGAGLGLALGIGSTARNAFAQANARSIAPSEWNKILDAARKEGKVVLYGTMSPAVHSRIVAAFSSAYPDIKMELVRVIGAAMPTKFEQERLAPNVEGGDAMITADVRWAMDAADKGWLKTPVGPGAAAWPEGFLKRGKIAMLGINPWVMSYNTRDVKTPINGYSDLLRPELAGKIGSTALVAEVVTSWYYWLDQTYPGYLEQLAKLNVKMYASSVAASNSTAAGEISANAFSVIPTEAALLSQSAPIRMVIPNPGSGFSYGGAVVSWAKNPNAALVVMNFLMSVPGQTALVGKEEAASPIANVPGALDASKLQLTMIDPEKYTPELLKAFEAKWNNLFKAK